MLQFHVLFKITLEVASVRTQLAPKGLFFSVGSNMIAEVSSILRRVATHCTLVHFSNSSCIRGFEALSITTNKRIRV